MEELMMRTRQFTIEELFQERVETKEDFEEDRLKSFSSLVSIEKRKKVIFQFASTNAVENEK